MTDSAPPAPQEPRDPDQPAAPPPPEAAPPPEAGAPPAAPAEYAPPPAPPQYAPPQAPPQYAPPPYAAAPPPPVRPGMVTGAGITMIVLGSLVCLFGLLFLIGGVFVSGSSTTIDAQAPGFGNFAGAVGGVIIVFSLIFLAVGVLDIVAGANVLGGRSWARITGIVVAAILGLFGLASLGGNSANGGNALFGVIVLAANAFIIWGLATTGAWFASRSG